jgi:hypothetical protein
VHPEIVNELAAELRETSVTHPHLDSEQAYDFSRVKVWNKCVADTRAILDMVFGYPSVDEETLWDDIEEARRLRRYERED